MYYPLLPGYFAIPLMCLLLSRFQEVQVPGLEELQVGLLRSAEAGAGATEVGETTEARQSPASQRSALLVPYLLLTAELITAVGAGMTVKFFGLWFKNVF